jgi:hypothetical protein
LGESLKFTPEAQERVNPSLFTTVQLASNDTIYMIGGREVTKDPRSAMFVAYCRSIDANLQVTDRAPLPEARCSIPLALVHDKWILAIGGMKGSSEPSNAVTAYDVERNEWHVMRDLTSPRTNCSAIIQG